MQKLYHVRVLIIGERASLTEQIRSHLLGSGCVSRRAKANLAAGFIDVLDGEKIILAPRNHLLPRIAKQRFAIDERILAADA